MRPLPDQYDHTLREKHWQEHWLTAGTYHWDESASREDTFVIDTPPPTVSGLLHMGHIFSYTHCDFVARFQRMLGKTVFYPMGFDDNGLPTERLVEKIIKKRATDMSREEFIEQCNIVTLEARAEFRRLFQSAALSVDWRQEYHTISDESRKISQMSFLDLFHKNNAYRKLQPMLWDPVDQTAIAQAEIEDKELPSTFNDITFAIDGSSEKITIGTTRPELIPACVAIFYHPDDDRYTHLKGRHAITPLFGVKVPILTDDTVEPDKGTGIMMCCTFGDEKDIEKWRKHDLDMRIVLNKYGKLDFTSPTGRGRNAESISGEGDMVLPGAKEAYAALQGLKVTNTDPKHPGARQKILEMLAASGDLIESKPITHAVKCAERSGAPLEILPTYQWFVKILDQKEQLKDKSRVCKWYPEWMQLRMEQWIDGLNWDWCISRQRYYGVPFPVWFSKRPGEEGKVLVGTPDQLPVNPLVDLPKGYTRDEVEAEADVMDTWATSSVSPQLSAKGINDTDMLDATRYSKLFPADMRPQAHEIIRTWAFYTLVKAHLHENTTPWKSLMISGWCLASDKTKMSKSKGNVVTPVELIEEKGTDSVRYWASTSRLGADTAFSEDLLKIGRKLVTKLWNASKFVGLQLEQLEGTPSTARHAIESGVIFETLDLWIISRLHKTIQRATTEFSAYEYCDARMAVEDFFWNDFCDNYLELVKSRAYGNAGKAEQQSACHTLWHCLNAVLKLFAPFVPHITEEIFSNVFEQEFQLTGSLHARGMWPNAELYPYSDIAEQAGIHAVSMLNTVRKAKSEKNVSLKFPVQEIIVSTEEDIEDQVWLSLVNTEFDLKAACNAHSAEWVVDAQPKQISPIVTFTEDKTFRLGITFAENAEVA